MQQVARVRHSHIRGYLEDQLNLVETPHSPTNAPLAYSGHTLTSNAKITLSNIRYYLGSYSGLHPDSMRSMRNVSFHTPRMDNRLCSAVKLPTIHSFSPSHSHQLATLPVDGSTTPERNTGNRFASNGIATLATTEKIPRFTAALNGKKHINLGSSITRNSKSTGLESEITENTRNNAPYCLCLCVYCA